MSNDESTTAGNRDAIVIDVVYSHPIERVWKALTDPASLAEWLMENDIRLILGHRFTFRDASAGPEWRGFIECEIVELDPPRRLAYTWDVGSIPPTLVRYSLETAPAGTSLRVQQSGFAAGGELGLTIRDIVASGWDSTLLRDRLPAFLDRMAAEEAGAATWADSHD